MTEKVLNENSTGILILILPLAVGIVLLYKAWPLLLLLLLLLILWKVWDTYQWKQWSQQVNPFFNQLIQENQGCLTPIDLSVKTNLSGKAAKRFLDRKAQEYGALRKNRGEEGIVYYFLTATALGSIFDDSEPEALPESDLSSVAFETQPVTETSPTETKSDSQEEKSASSPEVKKTDPETQKEESAASSQETVTEDQSTSPSEPSPDVSESSGSSPFAQLAAIKEERQQASESPKPDAPTEEAKAETTVPQTPSSESQFSKGLIQADLAKRLDLNASTVGRRKSDPDFPEWSQSKDPDGIAWKYIRKSKLFIPVEN